MIRTNFDAGWTFHRGQRNRWNPEKEALVHEEPVTLPHDFTISTPPRPDAPGGASTGYYVGGYGIYTKMFTMQDSERDSTVLLEFDGVYMNCEVLINGHLVTRHPYGYTAFHADLTGHLHFDRPNRLEVVANNTAEPNSRWYSGSGIYRSVELLTAPRLHIAPWGLFAKTDHVADGTAHIVVETTLDNTTDADMETWVVTMLSDPSGRTVATGKVRVKVSAGESCPAAIPLEIPNARLWEPDSPFLYQVKTELHVDGTRLDIAETEFGIRTFTADVRNGFQLNGKQMKLKGGCIHHDNGLLGAASFADSEFRKVRIHKDHGYNALRCAHNPPSRHLLEACDRLGVLVMDEAFDMWRTSKKINDYHLYFEDWWMRDIRAMVMRDRNHPSIVFWSIGNEIPERDGSSNGASWSRRLTDYVRTLDDTRLTAVAVCAVTPPAQQGAAMPVEENAEQVAEAMFQYWGKATEDYIAPLDVAGYNYLDNRYERDGADYPDRIICGTESFPLNIDIAWDKVERLPHVIGDFTWTSYDYLGEAGLGKAVYGEPALAINKRFMSHVSEFPWRLANCSDFDLCGFERPQLAYRRIVWGSEETYISVRHPANFGQPEAISRWGWPDCIDHWNWPGYEGKPISIEVYSLAENVCLYINGEKIGEEAAGKANRYKASFNAVYSPGEILAIGYIGGKEVSRKHLKTTGAPAGIRLTPDRAQLQADGHSLCYVLVEYIDVHGHRVPDYEASTAASVDGAATLAAFGAARVSTVENYSNGKFTSYEGRLQAILRSGPDAGKAALTVSGGGFCSTMEIPVE